MRQTNVLDFVERLYAFEININVKSAKPEQYFIPKNITLLSEITSPIECSLHRMNVLTLTFIVNPHLVNELERCYISICPKNILPAWVVSHPRFSQAIEQVGQFRA
jgi:hypothetical protein